MIVKPLLLTAATLLLAACNGSGPEQAPDNTAALAALPAPYNTADLSNGERVFGQCRSCHTLPAGGPNLVGPNLHGVFKRRIGTKADYSYSEPARAAGFQWDAAQLDRWLTDPRGFLPGTKMAFAGVKEPNDRRDVIAYLLIESNKAP